MLTVLTPLLDELFLVILLLSLLTAMLLGLLLAITGGSKSHQIAFEPQKHRSLDETTPDTRRAA